MTMPMSMSLHELLADQVDSMPVINPVINGLSADSRALKQGDVFVALAGATTHGLKFADRARDIGAAPSCQRLA